MMHSLIQAGVSAACAAELTSKAKPAIWLQALSIESEDQLRLGVTKIGGRPDLPRGMPWPMRPPYLDAEKRKAEFADIVRRVKSGGRASSIDDDVFQTQLDAVDTPFPLTFIAQIELGALPNVGTVLPRTGFLYFFYDALQAPWGLAQTDRVGWKVLHCDVSRADLNRIDPPDQLRQNENLFFQPLSCQTLPVISPLPSDTLHAPKGIAEEDRDRYFDWLPESGRHQVWGHPGQIQNDMQLECELYSRGLTWDDWRSEKRAQIERGANRWHMVFQIASDEKNGMLWGDAGNLYVWMHEDDLRSGRFDRAQLILQCY